MADNVTFQTSRLSTPPTGTVVAADVVDGVAYQRVKIAVGEDGIVEDFSPASEITLSATSILDLKSLGEEILGELKKMNIYLSLLTNEEIQDGEML